MLHGDSHTRALDKLRDSYKAVFKETGDASRAECFNAKEHDSLRSMAKRAHFCLNEEFLIQQENIELCDTSGEDVFFIFTGHPDSLENLSESTRNFIAAHEVKHASLSWNQSNGIRAINISTLSRAGKMVHSYLGKAYDKTEWDLPAVAYALAQRAIKWSCEMLSQKEEMLCDEFALRCFPDTNLEEFRDYLTASVPKFEENTKLVTIDGKASEYDVQIEPTAYYSGYREFRKHPEADARYDRLVKMQRKLLSAASYKVA